MDPIAWEGLADRIKADAEFAENARFWTGRLRLDVEGAHSRRFHMEDGKLASIEECEPTAHSELSISARPDVWREMLAAEPRPFYQDIYGASLYHGLVIDQRNEDLAAAYYPAIRRLVELLREHRNAIAAGAAGRED